MALSTKVGSFSKDGSGGVAAQPFSGFGFTPKMLIFWTTGGVVSDTWVDGVDLSIGLLDDSPRRRFFSNYYPDNQGTGAALQSGGGTGANIALRDNAGNVTAFGTATINVDGFTMVWSPNDSRTTMIHYAALGGTQMLGAYVDDFTGPASNGNKVVTGVGFTPSLLFLNAFVAGAVNSVATAQVGFGTLSDVWSTQTRLLWDGARIQGVSNRVENKIESVALTGGSALSAATLSAFGGDGFTLNYNPTNAGDTWNYGALRGPHVKVGSFTKPSGLVPVNQVVTGLNFRPSFLLLTMDSVANGVQTGRAMMSIGATDGTSMASGVYTAADNVLLSNTAAMDSTTKLLTKAANDTKTVEASLIFVSFDSDGFTLQWNVNDATAVNVGWVAIGPYEVPTAITQAASIITPTSVQMNGTVNPSGAGAAFPMSYKFEYGPTVAYGSSSGTVGGQVGSSDIAVFAPLGGLTPSTTYHYRVVAFNDAETVNGADQSFTTLAFDVSLMAF